MIGKNIGEIRKSRGLTLSQLAEQAKISKSYLSNIERSLNKNPSIDVIRRISKVLDVDVKVLLKTDLIEGVHPLEEIEWLDLIHDLKETGINKENIKDYKMLLEFIKWQNQSELKKSSEES